MNALNPKHYSELKASAISDEIIERYFSSIEGQDAQDWLIGPVAEKLGNDSKQYVTAPLKRLLEQSEHVKAGGWICRANGQIKPDQPRQAVELRKASGEYLPVFDKDNGPKLVKYESIREKPYRGAYVELMQPVGNAIALPNGQKIAFITEGGKKGGALASIGYEGVALPGVDMGTYTEGSALPELIPAPKGLAEAGYSFVFCFDQDCKKEKRRGVAGSLARLADELERYGCDVSVAVWPHKAAKGIDDLIVAKGEQAAHDAIREAKTLKDWKASLPANWFKKSIISTPGYKAELERLERIHAEYWAAPKADIVLNQQYLDRGVLGVPGTATVVDSPMKTGKTSSYLAGIVEQHKAQYPDAAIISSAYRNILLKQSGANLGITHWLDLAGIAKQHKAENPDDPSISAETDLSQHPYLAVAAESLAKLASQNIPEKSLFIIDEFVAYLRHIHTSDTMSEGSERIVCHRSLRTILDKVVGGGGWVVCLEADIPQMSIDCLKDYLPAGTPVSLIKNEYQVMAQSPVHLYSSANQLKKVQQDMAKAGVKICAASDSADLVDKQYRQMFNTEKDFHISSQNSESPEAQRFALNPKAELSRVDGLRVLSFSPTIGAGVSIDDEEGRDPWFDVKTGCFSHLSSADASQQTGRYRRDVPTHIYVRSVGNGIGAEDLGRFDAEKIRDRWANDAKYLHSLVDAAKYLADADGESMANLLKRSLEGEIPEVELLSKWRAIFNAADNFDKLHLKENLIARFKKRGHTIIEVESAENSEANELFKELKLFAEVESAMEFAEIEVADAMTPDDAHSILDTHGHSRAEKLEARKCLLQFEFPDCDFNNISFVNDWLIQGKGRKLSQLRAEWAARNIDAAKAIDRWHLKSKLKQAKALNSGVVLPDVRAFSPVADLLAKSGIADAIDTIATGEYNNSSPEVVKVADWAQANAPLLKKVVRLTIEPDQSPVAVFNRIARKFGYLPKSAKQSGANKKKQRTYEISDFCEPNRGHMLKSLSDKFSATLERKGEQLDGSKVSPVIDWGVSAEQLAARQIGSQPTPIETKTEQVELIPSITEGVGWEWQLFEADLIDANTYEQLQSAKDRAPKALRSEVMTAWEKDGRYDWLKRKAISLKGC
jgi:hypothetical protein